MPKTPSDKSAAKPAKTASAKAPKADAKVPADHEHAPVETAEAEVAPAEDKGHEKAEKPAEKSEKAKKVVAAGEAFVVDGAAAKREADEDAKLSPFLRKQKERLLALRDNILDSMNGVAKDTLRSRAEGSEASAFGMHQADAGSDAYDRDFALSLLSQEQDALYEIEQALKRIQHGSYGVCEMSGKPIAHARLEAIPFARYTVECQAQLEKQTKAQRTRTPVTSLFGLTDSEEGGEGEEEEPVVETKE